MDNSPNDSTSTFNPFAMARLAQTAASRGVQSPVSPFQMAAGASAPGYARTREMTLEELLLENRTLFLLGEINMGSTARLIMQILYLESLDAKKDINLYINSPGGVVDDTLAVYDIMKVIKCPVATYCVGRAESGGAVLLAAGTKGKRFILPSAKVMIHQPFGGVGGQSADIQIQALEILKTKQTLNKILADCTGQTPEKIEEDSERDRFFTASEAVKYGLVDDVLGAGESTVTPIAKA